MTVLRGQVFVVSSVTSFTFIYVGLGQITIFYSVRFTFDVAGDCNIFIFSGEASITIIRIDHICFAFLCVLLTKVVVSGIQPIIIRQTFGTDITVVSIPLNTSRVFPQGTSNDLGSRISVHSLDCFWFTSRAGQSFTGSSFVVSSTEGNGLKAFDLVGGHEERVFTFKAFVLLEFILFAMVNVRRKVPEITT